MAQQAFVERFKVDGFSQKIVSKPCLRSIMVDIPLECTQKQNVRANSLFQIRYSDIPYHSLFRFQAGKLSLSLEWLLLLENYCRRKQLVINVPKTKILTFGKGRVVQEVGLMLGWMRGRYRAVRGNSPRKRYLVNLEKN